MAAEEKWIFRHKPKMLGESREFFYHRGYRRDIKWECELEGLCKILYQAYDMQVFSKCISVCMGKMLCVRAFHAKRKNAQICTHAPRIHEIWDTLFGMSGHAE
jgi:hypothetical protein